MAFINSSSIIFYFGAIIIILIGIWFIYDEIKEDDEVYTEILWEEKKDFIIVSIIFIVIGIFIWGIVYLFITNHIEYFKQQYSQIINTIQKLING